MRVAFAGKPGTAVPAPHLYLELREIERNDTRMDQSPANRYFDLLVRCTEFRRDCVLFSEIPPLSQISRKGRRCLNHSEIMQGTALLVPRIAFELDVLYQKESYFMVIFVLYLIQISFLPTLVSISGLSWVISRGTCVSFSARGIGSGNLPSAILVHGPSGVGPTATFHSSVPLHQIISFI